MSTPRPGRRPGGASTREAVLAAARAEFAGLGYAGATVRGIARSAGVDPAMIKHHFGGKHELFLATLDLGGLDPSVHLGEVTAAGLDGLGERLLTRMLTVWGSPAGAAAVSMLRTAMQDAQVAALVREFITTEVVGALTLAIGSDVPVVEARRRALLVASQVMGLIMLRYVLALEPLASAPVHELVGVVGPTLQRYLEGHPPVEPLTP